MVLTSWTKDTELFPLELVNTTTLHLLVLIPGADFTNGLKPGLGLKFKTLVLNSIKNVLSQRA